MGLTEAQIRALRAVEAGQVVRIYRANGNILRGPAGVGAATLWRLHNMKLIEDGSGAGDAVSGRYTQVLTKGGRAALGLRP